MLILINGLKYYFIHISIFYENRNSNNNNNILQY